MEPSPSTAHADASRAFLEEVLRTGLGLVDLVEHLVEVLPDDAYPGEDTGDVVLEMLSGSIAPAVVAAGPAALHSAAALLGAVRDRAQADLERAMAIAEAREEPT